VVKVGIGKGEGVPGLYPRLDLPAYGDVSGELGKGVHLHDPLGSQYGEGDAGKAFLFDVGPFQIVFNEEVLPDRYAQDIVDDDEHGELVKNRVAFQVVDDIHGVDIFLGGIEDDEIRGRVINVVDGGLDVPEKKNPVISREDAVYDAGKDDVLGYDDNGLF
jgi:hypothetical protein